MIFLELFCFEQIKYILQFIRVREHKDCKVNIHTNYTKLVFEHDNKISIICGVSDDIDQEVLDCP